MRPIPVPNRTPPSLTSGLYARGAIVKPIPVRLAPLPAYDVADTIPLAFTPPELIVIFDATTDDKAMVLTGNGKMGGTDGFGVLRKNPKSSGYTGDILATSAGSAFFIMKLRKSEGYS